MPMERSRICGTIVNIYHNGITFVALNQRPRELPIDNYKRTQDTYDWLGLMRDSGKKACFRGLWRELWRRAYHRVQLRFQKLSSYSFGL